MTIKRYPLDQQGSSYFGKGEITELRAISFPGEKGAVTRVGPLFSCKSRLRKGRKRLYRTR
ncbi:hypothetical protein [Brevibacillus laterosporus]|uniref:hypothetical protein n=1 Tax=Brevibacillus laterosporus TaxID=1465 RepID=UPI0018CFB81D|nr:hypothetical protein [Brevibacillus laterosporus]MBG9787790.1 hypothetical protein [Brevibacillus laterosporus]MCG7315830.1 hypothetical protein [Brevibacillus laterosporus]